MLEFLKDNIIPIMVVISVAIFAFRFIRLMRSEKQAESKKSAGSESPKADENVEPADGVTTEDAAVQDGPDAKAGTIRKVASGKLQMASGKLKQRFCLTSGAAKCKNKYTKRHNKRRITHELFGQNSCRRKRPG